MALINYEEYFGFNEYKQAIRDAEKANTDFGKTINDVTTRIKSDYKSIVDELKPFVDTFKNFDVNQRNAAQTLTGLGTASGALTAKLEAQQKVLADITATNNLLEKSITDLKTANKLLETEYSSLNSAEEKDIARKKEILAEINRITPALQTQTQIMKSAKTVVDAADGSYNKMSAELKQIGLQLRALPNAFDPVTGKLNKHNAEAVALNKTYLELNQSLKKADAGMGVFFRDVGHYEIVIDKLKEGFGEFASSLLLAVGIIPGLFGIVDFLKDSTEKFNEEQVAIAQLENILKNIGRIDAFDRLKEKAAALSEEFKTFEGKEIIGVFQQLIQYGKLTERQINEVTPVIINFATITHQSLEAATNTILKSLEGNNRGLKQFGINIRDAKNTTEAFGLVMNELAPRVEGAAKAFGDTTAGQIKKTEVQITELKEQIGQELQPAIKLFYQTLSDGLKGIPQIFDTLGGSLNKFGETIKFNIELIAEFAKGGTTGAASLLAQQTAESIKKQDELTDAKGRTEAHQNAINIAEEAAKKPLKEQEQLLKSNEAILAASKKTALELNQANKSNTVEGRKATQQLIQDLETVEALKKSIEDQKDTRTLGIGDPNAPFTKGNADAAAAKAKAAFDKMIRDEEDALKGQYELELKQSENLLAQKKIDEVGYLQTRLNLTNAYVDKATKLELKKGKDADKQHLSDLQKLRQDALNDYTKASGNATLAMAQYDKELLQKQIESEANLQIQALKAEEQREIAAKGKTDLEKARLETEYQNRIDKIQIDSLNKQIPFVEEKQQQQFAAQIKLLEQGIKDRNKLFSDITEPQEFYKLGVKYITDQYNLKKDLNQASIQDEIDYYDKLIELAKKNDKDTTDLENKKKVALKKQIDEVFDYFKQSTQQLSNVIGSSGSNFFSDLIQNFQDISDKVGKDKSWQDWAATAVSAGNFVNDEFQKKSDERIAKFEAEKNRELQIVGNNTAAQAAINAKYAKLESQERRKKAIADKVTALFDIAINTAVAVSKLTAQSALLGIPLIPLLIALGAAQATLVIAQPLPAFKKGTKYAKEGFSIVDEAGYELVVDKHGKLKEVGTEKGARLTYLQTGDKVYTHTETKQILKNIETEKIIKETELTHRLSDTIQQGRINEAVHTMSKAMQLGGFNQSFLVDAFRIAIKDIPIHQTLIDERGQRERWKRGNDTVTYLNSQTRL